MHLIIVIYIVTRLVYKIFFPTYMEYFLSRILGYYNLLNRVFTINSYKF